MIAAVVLVGAPLLHTLPFQVVLPPIVTVVGVELSMEQLPLCTTALNCVVCVNAPEV